MKNLALGLAAIAVVVGSPDRATAQASPSVFTMGYRYDPMHRVTGVIRPDPDGSGPLHYAAVRNTYDSNGRLITVETGELSAWQPETVAPSSWGAAFTVFKTEMSTYDLMDQKVEETVSSGGTTYTATQYNYDAQGRLQCTAVRMNSAGLPSPATSACTLGTTGSFGTDRVTENVYDVAGQLLQVQQAVGTGISRNYETYAYTVNGKQAAVTDAKGNKTGYTYDGFDRLTQWAFPSPTSAGTVSSTDHEDYTYDANGNRLTLRKRDGRSFSFTYDALNRMTVKAVPKTCVSGYSCTAAPASALRDVYYNYDSRGLQLSARFDSATGTDAVLSAYDNATRQTSSNTSMGGLSYTLSYQYDADGNRTRVTYPDTNYFTYVYDGLDRPTAIQQSGSTTIATEAWDAQGRRSAETRGAVAIGYGYDAISRLASLSNDLAGTGQDVTTALTYTPASEVANETRSNDAYAWTAAVSVNRAYTPNGLNQYGAIAGTAQGYDSNGSLISSGGVSYTYDAENRLVAASTGASLVYDPMGRLFQTAGGSAGITQFLYDGDAIVAEYNGSGALLRRYVHGNDEDDPMLWYEGAGFGDMRSLQVDDQGSVVSIANSAGTILNIDSYDEYGIPGNANAGRFQYTGQAWIPELGLYHYKARAYSPTLGRFLQIDPVGYKDNVNLYAYVANDPVNHADPTGNGPEEPLIEDLTEAASEIAESPFGQAVETKVGAAEEFVGIRSTPSGPQPADGEAIEGIPMMGAEREGAAVQQVYRGSTLARNMAKAGNPVAKGEEEAHHLVAQRAAAAQPARDVLQRVGIGIHDAENGAAAKTAVHAGTHTADYYGRVNQAMQGAENAGKDAVISVLDGIRSWFQ